MIALIAEIYSSLARRSRVECLALGFGFFSLNMLDLAGALALGGLVAMALGSQVIAGHLESFLLVLSISQPPLTVLTFLVLTLFLLKAAVSILVTLRYGHFLRALESRGYREIVQYLLSGGLTRLQSRPRAETAWAISSSASVTFGTLLGTVIFLFADILSALITLLVLLALDPLIAIVVLFYFALVGVLYQLTVRTRIAEVSNALLSTSIATGKWSHDLLEGFREIVVSNYSSRFEFQFGRTREASLRAISQDRMLGVFPRLFIELSLILGIVFLVIWLIQSGSLVDDIAIIAVFVVGGLKLVGSLLPIQNRLTTILTARDQAKTGLDWQRVSQPAAVLVEPRFENIIPSDGANTSSLEFEDVSFSYLDRDPVLSHLSFSLVGDGIVSLRGPSGAGKTTIGNLSLGLLSPQAGEVRLFGMDPTMVRRQGQIAMALVPQRMVAFSGTVAQNIALGVDDQDLDFDHIEELLDGLGILDAVMALPNGLHTELAGHFDLLSGGQYQRLALARAFYSRPAFAVLDEATNALDDVSKSVVFDFIVRQAEACLVLAISHDRNLMDISREIITISNGRLRTNLN